MCFEVVEVDVDVGGKELYPSQWSEERDWEMETEPRRDLWIDLTWRCEFAKGNLEDCEWKQLEIEIEDEMEMEIVGIQLKSTRGNCRVDC